jgi:thiol-disulfide isomerase/thioredoxin
MIWGEDEGTSNSQQRPDLAAANRTSSQEFDRLVTEVRLLRQEVRQLRELANQRDRPQESPAFEAPLPAKTKTDSETVLLYFTATWCGPCQQMNPIVNRLKKEGLSIREVDVDKDPAMPNKYGVTSIPCFQLVVAGKPVDRYSGIASENQLRKMLSPRQAGSTRVTPLRDYRGQVSGDPLLSSNSREGLVNDSRSFEKLCADWKLNRKEFDIDFSRQFVVVATAAGSSVSLDFSKDEKGNLKGSETATCDLWLNAFTYYFAVISREGIKSYNGNELTAIDHWVDR